MFIFKAMHQNPAMTSKHVDNLLNFLLTRLHVTAYYQADCFKLRMHYLGWQSVRLGISTAENPF
jgi:hypothetical protein